MCQQVYLDSCNIQYFTQGYDKIFIFLSPHRDPVYTSPDKTLHRSTFHLHRTHGTAKVFERQTVLHSVTEFGQFHVNGLICTGKK